MSAINTGANATAFQNPLQQTLEQALRNMSAGQQTQSVKPAYLLGYPGQIAVNAKQASQQQMMLQPLTQDVFNRQTPKAIQFSGVQFASNGQFDQNLVKTMVEFKEHLAQLFHLTSILELDKLGILRIALDVPANYQDGDKNVVLDVLIEETQYDLIKHKIPADYKGYPVRTHRVIDKNPPIS